MSRHQLDPSHPAFAFTTMNDFHATLKSIVDCHIQRERRSNHRTPSSIELKIQPLDWDYRADGEPFNAVSRDISTNGMGFVNSDPLQHDFVSIAMPAQTQARVIARVCYNLSIGTHYPLYLVGVQFVT